MKKKQDRRELAVHGVYRHYKGGLYMVEGVAVHSEDLVELVIYRSLSDTSKVWARPLQMFLDRYDGEHYRFEHLADGVK